MNKRIGIVGLGRVGKPAAEAYIAAGYTVFGYDIRARVCIELAKTGIKICKSLSELAESAEVILVMVLNDAQVETVFSGDEGLLSAGQLPSIVVCMSTINRRTLEEIAALCADKGVELIDCPFTGGPARVPGGNLTLIAAAPESVLTRTKHHLEVLGKITYAGETPGLAQSVKHCNQLMVGTIHAATMEVIHLSRQLNLDPALVVDVVGNGIAGSDYFKLLSESVLTGQPSPGGLGQMCKDVAIVINTIRNSKMHALVASAMSGYFMEAESLGMQDREGADLIQVIQYLQDRPPK